MKFPKAFPWLTALVLLGGCGEPLQPLQSTPELLGLVQLPPRLGALSASCPASVVERDTVTCTVSATDEQGRPFAVSSYTWTSSDERLAKVDAAGKVTTLRAGSVVLSVSATQEGVTKQASPLSIEITEHPPLIHSTHITANETWRASDNPHVVRGLLSVENEEAAVTLTLEAGVEVRFDADAHLLFKGQGALRAQGTQEAPIQMVANTRTPIKGFWRGLVFFAKGSGSQMDHVTMNHCGSEEGNGACISIVGESTPVLRDVTVMNAAYAGVSVDETSAFGAGSARLSVSGSGDYGVSMRADSASSLPVGGSYTGNLPADILVFGNVTHTQTWPNPGSPYTIISPIVVETMSSTEGPTLTLSAGSVFRFGEDGSLEAGTHPDGYPSELIVNGTEAAPVRFTAHSASPQPGSWRGLHLGDGISGTSRISHAIIEYAGAPRPGYESGNLNIKSGCDGCPLLEDVILQKSSNYGLTMPFSSLAEGSTRLTIRDNGGYAVKTMANGLKRFPANSTFSGNAINAVEVVNDVLQTQTWPNLGIPYVITGTVNVYRSPEGATLTLLPGAEVRFAKDAELIVGINKDSPGALVAQGTAQAPIRFVADAQTPTKGSWGGVHLLNGKGSRLDHVLVSHAGSSTRLLKGNLNVYREDGPFITNSTFSAGKCPISVTRGTATDTDNVTTDFSLPQYNNTFLDNDTNTLCTD